MASSKRRESEAQDILLGRQRRKLEAPIKHVFVPSMVGGRKELTYICVLRLAGGELFHVILNCMAWTPHSRIPAIHVVLSRAVPASPNHEKTGNWITEIDEL
jgi:hypothetical protein